jgi:hypothetical protein
MAEEADDNEIRRKLKTFIFPTDAGAQNSSNVGQIEEVRPSGLPTRRALPPCTLRTRPSLTRSLPPLHTPPLLPHARPR